MGTELKPCPFCGGEGTVLSGSSYEFGIGWVVECLGCHSTGKAQGNERDAISAWNTRYCVDKKEGK